VLAVTLHVSCRFFLNRLHAEQVSRHLRKLADASASPPALAVEELDRLLWPITHALDNPDLNRNAAAEVRELLASLVGEWRIAYLATVTQPETSITDAQRRRFMSFVAGQTHPEVTNLIAKMLSDQADEAVVADVIRGLDEIVRMLAE
jgi:hypothetical protein